LKRGTTEIIETMKWQNIPVASPLFIHFIKLEIELIIFIPYPILFLLFRVGVASKKAFIKASS
jgi:hypothetical protein